MTNISRFQFEQMQRRVQPQPAPEPDKEYQLHQDIMEYCDAQWPRWKYIHSRFGVKTRNEPGVPDFIIALPRRLTIYVEAKRPGEKLTPAQRDYFAELSKLDQLFFIVHNMQEFLDTITYAYALPVPTEPLTTTKPKP